MADDQPPWATRKYSTPPPSTPGQDATAAPSRGDIPGTSKYDQPPPSPPPPPPPSDPFIRDLTDPGWQGSLARGAAGVTQGFILDPAEKLGELTGIGQNPPKWLEDRLQATREAAGQTTPGEIGRVGGAVANPLWRFLPAIKATEYAGPTARALTKLATSIYQGAVGGAAEPTGAKTPAEAVKQTVPQLLQGGAIGGALGAPGAAAARLGYENVQQPVREILRDMPLEFRRLERLRNLSKPAFTRWWHEQSLEPIGGKVPGGSGKEVMDKVGMQIGGALDNATALMSFDMNKPAVRGALAKVRGDSAINLASSGNALNEYNRVINDLVTGPLVINGGRLNPARLRQITSNLDAHIRAIDPGANPDQALLKRELENYRMAMFDNADGTPAQKAAYAKARQAWRIHATGRDSQPLGEPHGHLDPDAIAREMDRRNPLRYPYGGGPRGRPDSLQRAVNQAQQALGNMPGAARRGKAGRPLTQPEDFARPAGAAGAVVAPTQEQRDQPLSYSWPNQ